MTAQTFSDPEAAEAAFYHAFESADTEAMMRVWAEHPDVLCVHPMGPALRGIAAVRRSWEQMFQGTATLRFEVNLVSASEEPHLAVRVVEEHIHVSGEPHKRPPIVATNVYRLTPAGWRIILHHASPSRGSRAPERPAGPLH